MEKTLEIHLQEQREQIALDIESKSKEILEEARVLGADAYLVASRSIFACLSIVKNHK